MSPLHHNTKTETKTCSPNVLIIVNLPVVSSLDVTSQSWTKSNKDSLSKISFSRDGTTKGSPLNCRQPFTFLLCPARLSKDGSESSKTAIYLVMTIRVRLGPCKNSDQSCRSSLIGVHFQAPDWYQDTFPFLLQLWKKSWDESWD
jgi:hypothetical protein